MTKQKYLVSYRTYENGHEYQFKKHVISATRPAIVNNWLHIGENISINGKLIVSNSLKIKEMGRVDD